MADYAPVFLPGTVFTSQASATITGGQVLEVSGNGTVAPAGAGSVKVVGVAAHDAASGAKVAVIANKVVHDTTAGTGGITAGNNLLTEAAGVVVAGAAAVGTRIGVAMTTATVGNVVRWMAV
jgi:hypothetical protein